MFSVNKRAAILKFDNPTLPQIPPHAPMPSSSPNLPPASKMGTILDNRTKHLVNIDNLISTQTPTR